MALVAVMALVTVVMIGCSSVTSSVSQETKVKIASGIGKIATVVYIAEQDKLTPEQKEAVTKVWEAFRDNADKYANQDINKFPDFLKATLKDKVSNAKVLDIANKLIDTYWVKLVNAMNKVGGMTPTEFAAIILGFRDGIKDGLALFNLKVLQP